MNDTKVLYLACPYTHKNHGVMRSRYDASCRATAKLMKVGVTVFNPLSHSYPLLEYLGDVTEDHEFWMRQDLPVLRRCNELLILGLPDWERSRGVKDELFTALSMNIPVTLIEEDDIDALPVIPKSARQFLKSNILQTAEEES